MKFEEFKKYVDETLENVYSKLNEEEKTFISDLVTKFNQKCEENQLLKDRIEKAIEYIENSYYSKNTINIDDIAMTTNKFLKIREILKGDKEC